MAFGDMLSAYLGCALWSSTDESGEPLDSSYGIEDLSEDFRKDAVGDLTGFLYMAMDAGLEIGSIHDTQIGHDFWLTRNHHGVGFWDRGLGELGDKLTEIAHSFGEVGLYVGDDGLIHAA